MKEQIIQEIVKTLFKPVKVRESFTMDRVTLNLMENNAIMYQLNGENIDWFYSRATTIDGREIDTRNAKATDTDLRKTADGFVLTIQYKKKKLTLTQKFTVRNNTDYFIIELVLSSDREISSNYLAPLDFIYPEASCKPLFLSLDEKMLVVPYDNDMWSNYETTYLQCGRTSYDLTCIFDETSLEGLLIGALDTDVWKNGIVISGYDARVFTAVSGIADYGTHDCLPHGALTGREIRSSAFVCGYFDHIDTALTLYGSLVACQHIYPWKHGTPFGWNSYSGLAMHTDIPHFLETSSFFRDELPDFHTEEDTVFINFDGVFGLDDRQLRKAIDTVHARGQKAGTYLAPCAHLNIMNILPLKGSFGKFHKDIVLKKPDGTDYAPVDGKLPIDISIPAAEQDLRLSLREIIDKGFDYIKFDFLGHGALEGIRHNRDLKTGRQALVYLYDIILDELKDSDIFVSFSIAPLFPGGYCHGRRASCDAFGHHEDVRYILNALNYSYWANGTIYQFNDPDHTVLYKSVVDKRGTTSLNEARSRYNASAISGTVMLLSDNYGPKFEGYEDIEEARKRTAILANNAEINKIARLNRAFKPLTYRDTASIYYLNTAECTYLAVFNFTAGQQIFTLLPQDINVSLTGSLTDLNENTEIGYMNKIEIVLDGYDSRIYQIG